MSELSRQQWSFFVNLQRGAAATNNMSTDPHVVWMKKKEKQNAKENVGDEKKATQWGITIATQ